MLFLLLLRKQRRRITTLLFWAFTLLSLTSGWRSRPVPLLSQSLVVRGGGALSEEETNAALDAYIEELIASVDTTDDEAADQPTLQVAVETTEVPDETAAATSAASRTEPSAKAKKVSKTVQKKEVSKKEKVPKKASKKKKPTASKRAKQKKRATVKGKAAITAQKETLELAENSKTDSSKNEETPAEASVKVAATSSEKKETTKEASDTLRPARTQRPPSTLQRFFLRQGLIGKVISMLLLLIEEFIDTYLPPLAQLRNLVGSTRSSSSGSRTQRDWPERPTATDLSSTAVSSRRTGQTGKQRRTLTQQADKAALEQLKRVGNVEEAKYRYVSQSFLKRHGLGSYAKKDTSKDLDREEKDERVETHTERIERKREEVSEDEDDDDWVLQALTESVSVKPFVKSTLTGSDEGHMGSDSERVSSVVAAIKKKRKKKKKKRATGPRASDKDGGDGIFGRIRAATGVNSRVSRNIFGAYPGDAAPPEEAGSAGGLMDLAQKYGWGNWSDDENDEDDDFDLPLPRKTRRTKRKRVSTTKQTARGSSSKIGIEINLTGGRVSTKKSTKKRRRSSRTSTSNLPDSVNQPPLSPRRAKGSSSDEREISAGKPVSSTVREEMELLRNHSPILTPLDGISEVKQRKKKRKKVKKTKRSEEFQ